LAIGEFYSGSMNASNNTENALNSNRLACNNYLQRCTCNWNTWIDNHQSKAKLQQAATV